MKNLKPKIIFVGTPKFGAIILKGLIKNKYKPVLVITAPDKPVGRKKIITPPPAKISAKKYNIPISQPEILANYKLQITNYKPDLIICAAYGQIIPKKILDIPEFGVINVHPSLLPRYRGPSPIQAAILNGDKETGVTIILMNEKLDSGPIISNFEFSISNSDTCQILSQKLAELGVKLLLETIPKWINKEIKARPQDESKASYTRIIKKDDGKIDWQKSATEIERQIRAFYPWPGSFTFWNGKRLKILKAEICPSPPLRQTARGLTSGKTGKTFLNSESELCIQCKKGCLIIKELQLEGKKPMNSEEFLKGHSEFVGAILK